MHTRLLAVPLSLFLVTAAACEVVGEDEEALDEIEATVPTTEVARAVTGGGLEHEDVWRFVEAEPGELFLHAILSEKSAQQFAYLKLEMRVSYVELYQSLTGKPAPVALVEAQARADALAEDEDEDEDPDRDDSALDLADSGETPDSEDGIGRVTRQISANDFQELYCDPNTDYLYCWPSTTGNPWVQRTGYAMYARMAAVNTSVDFRFRHKTFGTWKTLVSATALPGELHFVSNYYYVARRSRRFEVLNNGNNAVRFTVFGYD